MFDNFFNMLFGNIRSRGSNNYRTRCTNKFIYNLIPFEKAKEMIENKKVILIDVRSKSEYDLMHIINSVNIPVNEIEKRIFIYEQKIPIMIYCSSGARSKSALQILNSLGYTNIYIWEYGALATFPYKDMLVYGDNI